MAKYWCIEVSQQGIPDHDTWPYKLPKGLIIYMYGYTFNKVVFVKDENMHFPELSFFSKWKSHSMSISNCVIKHWIEQTIFISLLL